MTVLHTPSMINGSTPDRAQRITSARYSNMWAYSLLHSLVASRNQ